MKAREERVVQEGLCTARLALQIAGLKWQVAAMQREIDELKATLARLESDAQV